MGTDYKIPKDAENVTHPYSVPNGVSRGSLLGDPILMVCATIIVLGIIAAVVVLSVTNHSADAVRYVGLAAQGFVSLVLLLGLGKRAGDIHAQGQATYLRLNGELDQRITAIVTKAIADRRHADPPMPDPPAPDAAT